MIKEYNRKQIICICILILGILFRLGLFIRVHYFLECDESYQALLARDISRGEIFPVTLYQVPYIGAFEEYLIAIFMLAFGSSLLVFKIYYFLSSISGLILGNIFFKKTFNFTGTVFALSLLAFLPVPILTSQNWGWSFSALIWMSFLILYLAKILESKKEDSKACIRVSFSLGIVMGLSLYNNFLSLFLIIGIILFAILNTYKKKLNKRLFTYLFGGIFLTYFPMITFNFKNSFISYKYLLSKFFNITTTDILKYGILESIINGIKLKFSTLNFQNITYLFSPREFSNGKEFYNIELSFISYIMVFIISGFILISYFVWVIEKYHDIRKERTIDFTIRDSIYIVAPFGLFFISEVYYFNAFIPIFIFIIAEGIIKLKDYNKWIAIALFGIYIIYNSWSITTVVCNGKKDPLYPILHRLEKLKLTHGYGNHAFQGYSAFLTDNKIRLSPQVGPSSFVDKIPEFSKEVDRTTDVFYLLPDEHKTTRSLITYLHDKNISYKFENIDNYKIFYSFNKRFYPIEFLPTTEQKHYYRWSYKENPKVLNRFRGGK